MMFYSCQSKGGLFATIKELSSGDYLLTIKAFMPWKKKFCPALETNHREIKPLQDLIDLWFEQYGGEK